jgi:hypothetical protein
MKILICGKSSSCSINFVRSFKHRLCKCAVSGVSPRTDTGQPLKAFFLQIDKLALSHLQGKRINCLSPRDIILIQSSADAE